MIDEIFYLLWLACFDPVPGSAHSPRSSILPRKFPGSRSFFCRKGARKWAGLRREQSITTKRRRWEECGMGKGGGGGVKRDGRRRMKRRGRRVDLDSLRRWFARTGGASIGQQPLVPVWAVSAERRPRLLLHQRVIFRLGNSAPAFINPPPSERRLISRRPQIP